MAIKRKLTIKVHKDRGGWTRTTERRPFNAAHGERFDRVRITYRPHGFWEDMVHVFAWFDGLQGNKVEVWWSSSLNSGQDGTTDKWTATVNFARAVRDAMLQATRLRRHMGIAEVNPQKVEEWKR